MHRRRSRIRPSLNANARSQTIRGAHAALPRQPLRGGTHCRRNSEGQPCEDDSDRWAQACGEESGQPPCTEGDARASSAHQGEGGITCTPPQPDSAEGSAQGGTEPHPSESASSPQGSPSESTQRGKHSGKKEEHPASPARLECAQASSPPRLIRASTRAQAQRPWSEAQPNCAPSRKPDRVESAASPSSESPSQPPREELPSEGDGQRSQSAQAEAWWTSSQPDRWHDATQSA